MKLRVSLALLMIVTIGLQQSVFAQAIADRSIADKIKAEAVERSQVMDTLMYLTDSIGPRLTGSPAARRANKWTLDRLTSYGLVNGRLHAYKFGRGWTVKRFSAEVVAPVAFPILAMPRGWSPGFTAPISGEVVHIQVRSEADLAAYKGKLKGKFVMIDAARPVPTSLEPRGWRFSAEELLDKANAPGPLPGVVPNAPASATPEQLLVMRLPSIVLRFVTEEGAAAVINSSRAQDGGLLQHVTEATVIQPANATGPRVRPWQPGANVPPQIMFTADDYNRIARMAATGPAPVLNVNMQVEFDDSDTNANNTLADIPGSDLKDEIVMIGAHLDSWHTGTGTTDNATGVAVIMEAARILKAIDLKPRRTIRVGLWTGEEQGLLGARAYVADEFGPGKIVEGKPTGFNTAYDKFGVYLNLDSGTGAIRGIGLDNNEGLRPHYRNWLRDFANFKVGNDTFSARTVSVTPGEGSDYLAFTAVKLNAMEFMQDPIEYGKRTWHTNQDNLDRALPNDLKQAAAVVAWFAYNAANSDTLPRKP